MTPFIFRIDELRENENAPPAFDPLNHARWMPARPTPRVAGGASGHYWYCTGQAIQYLPQLPSDMMPHSVYSIFWKTGHGYWILRGDASAQQSLEDWESWQPLSFDYVGNASYLTNAGEHDHAKNTRSDQSWAHMLLSNIYYDNPTTKRHPPKGVLIGELGILLGLLAFSMRPEQMNGTLPRIMHNSKLQVHSGADGRDDKRGVVVQVYTSASWHSTAEGIEAVQNGSGGGYYR